MNCVKRPTATHMTAAWVLIAWLAGLLCMQVTLCPLQLQPNGPARTLVLPLQKASNSRAAVQLHVQWLKSTKRPPAQDAAGAPRRMQQGQRVVGAPSSSLTQPPKAQAPSPQPVPRSVSAFAASSKAVSWQDKVRGVK